MTFAVDISETRILIILSTAVSMDTGGGAWRGRGTGQGCRQRGHCSDHSTCDQQPVEAVEEAGDSSGSGLIGLQIVGALDPQQALLPRPRHAPSPGHLPSPMFRSLPIMTCSAHCSASSTVTVHSTRPDNAIH